MIMSCSHCCKQYDMEIVKKIEHFDYDGFHIEFSSDFYKCPECGELTQTVDQFQSSLDSLRDEQKKMRKVNCDLVLEDKTKEAQYGLRNKKGC